MFHRTSDTSQHYESACALARLVLQWDSDTCQWWVGVEVNRSVVRSVRMHGLQADAERRAAELYADLLRAELARVEPPARP